MPLTRRSRLVLFCLLAAAGAAAAQAPGPVPRPMEWTTAQDHRNMMEQLGIRTLRPGPSGNENAPNHANYDESRANPFPDLPDALTLRDGRKVTTAATWWSLRRPEIVEDFEREVVGRVPRNAPGVMWSVTSSEPDTVGSRAVIRKQLVGHVDNSACPLISVDIQMTLVTPAGAGSRVPVMMMFGRGGTPRLPAGAAPAATTGDPPATEQLITAGWGFAFINPASIQADNGAGLTRGIIGLVNRGQPRKPDDWGALRAWAWGASRGLDYLETDGAVDANRVGIEGVSRYGKAALVAMAFDTRFAVVLVGSSGEGGAKPHRRNFGEAVENLTGSGEYHWMAGNFLKYGAAEATFGSMNAGDLPVDAHELIALCAPRPTFISYGVPEKGDAKWLDQRGSFMAAVAAGQVFRLLGARDLGTAADYRTEKMPPVNTGLLDGHLAWRQHDGGHTDGPNWKYFIPWADKLLANPQFMRIGIIDFYGLEHVTADKARAALAFREGDAISFAEEARPSLLAESERRLAALPGVARARAEVVCCEAGRVIVYVGIEERGAPGLRLRAAPTGDSRLAADVVQAGADFSKALELSVLRGTAGEDRSQGHALSLDPAVRAVQERIAALAGRDLAAIRKVLRYSADAAHRALAAQVLGYARDKQGVVADLVAAMGDPADDVRNNAMRALMVFAEAKPVGGGRSIRVPYRPFVELVRSPVWSDRNKAAGALMALSAGRDKGLLTSVRRRALAALSEMARWTSEGHAYPAFIVLGRVAGYTDAELEQIWVRGERGRVLTAAAQGR